MADISLNPNCQQNPPLQHIVYTFLLPISCTILTLSMLPLIYFYIKAYREKFAKPAFVITSVFFLILFADFIVLTFNNALYCHHALSAIITGIVSYYLYMIQAWLLASVFSIRLVSIFNKGPYKVSKRVFAIIVIGVCLTTVAISLLHFARPVLIGIISVSLIWMVWIAYMVWLNYTLIRKLLAVSKGCQEEETQQSMTTVIVKTALLCLISSSISLITLCFVAGRDSVHNMYLDFLSELFILLDLYSNLLSVFLSFAKFEKWYFKLCGCCHRRVVFVCGIRGDIEMMKATVDHVSSTSNPSDVARI